MPLHRAPVAHSVRVALRISPGDPDTLPYDLTSLRSRPIVADDEIHAIRL